MEGHRRTRPQATPGELTLVPNRSGDDPKPGRTYEAAGHSEGRVDAFADTAEQGDRDQTATKFVHTPQLMTEAARRAHPGP